MKFIKSLGVILLCTVLLSSCVTLDEYKDGDLSQESAREESFSETDTSEQATSDFSDDTTTQNTNAESEIQSTEKKTEKHSEEVKTTHSSGNDKKPVNEVESTSKTVEQTTQEVTFSVSETTAFYEVTEEQTQEISSSFCTISIECKTILDNMDSFNKNKAMFLPSDGVILKSTKVKLNGGETVFDILKYVCADFTCSANCKYCKNNGIFIEYSYSPAFDNYYIEGLHQIYEKDCGSLSGWMYSVNGVFPNVGASSYSVSDGDVIEFRYTCDMGADIGDTF